MNDQGFRPGIGPADVIAVEEATRSWMTISKKFTFEASHVLPLHEGKCSRLHGHSWGLTVAVRGKVDLRSGFVVDYAKLKEVVNKYVVDRLDHHHLGQGGLVDVEKIGKYPCVFGHSFYPSSENLTLAIAKILKPLIPELAKGCFLFSIELDETCTSKATWRWDDA